MNGAVTSRRVLALVQELDPLLARVADGTPELAGLVAVARKQLAEDCMDVAVLLGDGDLGVQALAMTLENA